MITAKRTALPLERARPFLKWAGGKTQLLAPLLARFPKNFNRYHEPFVGGGAVFFALRPKRAVLSDLNEDLIGAYCALKSDARGVIEKLIQHRAEAEYFYQVRAQNGRQLSAPASAARIIYLNRTCFNGLYRVNQSGLFNVPFGRHTNPTICNVQNLKAVSVALKGAVVRCQSALKIGRQVRRNDLVYFDPPYDRLDATSFTHYHASGFGRDEQVRLAKLAERLAGRGVHVVLSNSDTPFIRQLYARFRIDSVMARRSINSRASGRGPVGEVIITVG